MFKFTNLKKNLIKHFLPKIKKMKIHKRSDLFDKNKSPPSEQKIQI